MSDVLTAAGALSEAPATEAPAAAAAPVAATESGAAPEASEKPAEKAQEPGFKVPGADATDEERAAFYKALGVPDDPSEYKVALLEGEPEENLGLVQSMFKKANLTPAQAEALLNERAAIAAKQAEIRQQQEAAKQEQTRKEETALKTEWGQDHAANMELAKRAVRQFLPAEKAGDILGALEEKVGYAETIRLMHAIGKGLGEHDAPGLGSAKEPVRKSAAEILYGGTQG